MNRNPVRPGRRRRERRGKRAQHWLRAGILLSLLMFAVSGAALGLQWSRYRQSEQLYQDLRTQIRDTASAGSGEDTGGNRASQKDFPASKPEAPTQWPGSPERILPSIIRSCIQITMSIISPIYTVGRRTGTGRCLWTAATPGCSPTPTP